MSEEECVVEGGGGKRGALVWGTGLGHRSGARVQCESTAKTCATRREMRSRLERWMCQGAEACEMPRAAGQGPKGGESTPDTR